jgi:hypothetical protein
MGKVIAAITTGKRLFDGFDHDVDLEIVKAVS